MRELADSEEAVHINAAEEIPAAKAALAAAERRADQGQYTEGAGRRGKLARRIDGQMDRLVTSLREREEIVAEMQRLARRLGMGFDARNRFALPNFIREALRPFDSSLGLADAKDRGKTFHELERGFCKPPTWPETEREEL